MTILYSACILFLPRRQTPACILYAFKQSFVAVSVVSIYLYVLATTEPALCDALYSHLEGATNRHELRFLVAIYMTVMRVALEEWLEQEARGDLVSLLCKYLDSISSLSHNT